MSVHGFLHDQFVKHSRVRRLSNLLTPYFAHGKNVLEIGAGDGKLAAALIESVAGLEITGIDVLERSDAAIPIQQYDGSQIPFDDKSFDIALIVDVLHHTSNQEEILGEAKRVAKDAIVLKDHLREGLLAQRTLQFMDWVGNARYGVSLPFEYWTTEQWQTAFRKLNLEVTAWNDQLKLYPTIPGFFFNRSLHFIAELRAGSHD